MTGLGAHAAMNAGLHVDGGTAIKFRNKCASHTGHSLVVRHAGFLRVSGKIGERMPKLCER
jgi:predicted sugar kinase